MKKIESEKSFSLAKERYADIGVDVDRVLKNLEKVPVSLHCWQGDDVGGFENVGGTLGGGIMATGNYPGKARTPTNFAPTPTRRCRSFPASTASTCTPSTANRRQEGRAERDRARAFQGLDGLGEVDRHRPGFQPHLLLASEGGRRLHAVASRRGHPPLLGRARHRLPQDRRGDRPALGTPCVTNVWIPDGMKDTTVDRKGPRERLAEVAGRGFRAADRSGTTSTRSRASCSASARRATSSARTSSTSAMPSSTRSCLTLDAGHFTRPKRSPTRSRRCSVSCGNPAARQPRRPLGQRPRGDPQRRRCGRSRRNSSAAISSAACTSGWISSTPASTAWRRGSSARATCSAPCARHARADGQAQQLEARRRFHLAAGAGGRGQDAAVRRGLGLLLRKQGVPVGEAWLAEVKRYEKKVLSKRQ